MDYKTAIQYMRNYFKTGWESATPILWGFDDPQAPPSNATWVRFNILHSDGRQITMGSPASNRFERIGIITIQVFSPIGNYAVDAVEKATAALKLYEGVENNGIFYYDAYCREIGNDGQGWNQINVIVTFRYEEIT